MATCAQNSTPAYTDGDAAIRSAVAEEGAIPKTIQKRKASGSVSYSYSDGAWRCEECGKHFRSERDKVLECEYCGKHYCIKCLKYKTAEYEAMQKPGCMWFCLPCKPKIARVKASKCMIVGIAEVKPKHQRFLVNPAELKIDGYEMYHCNIGDDRGRGVMTVCSWVLYTRAPEDQHNLYLNGLITEAVQSKHSHFLLLGDFNYPSINWEACSTDSTVGADYIFPTEHRK